MPHNTGIFDQPFPLECFTLCRKFAWLHLGISLANQYGVFNSLHFVVVLIARRHGDSTKEGT